MITELQSKSFFVRNDLLFLSNVGIIILNYIPLAIIGQSKIITNTQNSI